MQKEFFLLDGFKIRPGRYLVSVNFGFERPDIRNIFHAYGYLVEQPDRLSEQLTVLLRAEKTFQNSKFLTEKVRDRFERLQTVMLERAFLYGDQALINSILGRK